MNLNNISEKSLGTWIRSIHFSSPLIILIIVSLGKPLLVHLTVFFTLLITLLYLLCNDCFLSIYEQRLLNDDIYGIDATLEVFNIPVNEQNRYKGTLLVAIAYYIIMISILQKRFKIVTKLYVKLVS